MRGREIKRGGKGERGPEDKVGGKKRTTAHEYIVCYTVPVHVLEGYKGEVRVIK